MTSHRTLVLPILVAVIAPSLATAQTMARPGDRDADAYLVMAEQAYAERSGPERESWTRRVDAEAGAFRWAFDELAASGAGDRMLRLALALEPYWLEAGGIVEMRDWYRRALALPASADADLALRGRALMAAGVLAMEQRDLAPSGSYLEEALELARAGGDRLSEARALLGLARLGMRTEDHEEVRERAAAAVEIYRGLDSALGVAAAEHVLGNAAMMLERYGDAIDHFERALAVYRDQGREGNVSVELFNIGSNAVHLGDLSRARPMLAESLRIMRRRDARSGWVYPILGFGWIAARENDLVRAAILFGAVDADMERQERVLDPAERLHHQRYLEEVRRGLSAEAFERAWERGRAMSIEEAADYALVGEDARPGR